MSTKTLYDKIWDDHIVYQDPNGDARIYVDCHFVHEVTSPQAFEALKLAQRKLHAPERTFAVADHTVSTQRSNKAIKESQSKSLLQVETLERNAKEFNIEYFALGDSRQGIVHIIGPEQGLALPGQAIVCGDSHTSTHGAFGALAFGVGTSEVEHVLATQTVIQKKAHNMLVRIDHQLPEHVDPKDLILAIIAEIGTSGGTGYVIEYAGEAVRALSMEGRMTICNMSIEAGAKAGLIAPDQVTFDYLKDKPRAPKGQLWQRAHAHWQKLRSDENAPFERTIVLDAQNLAPLVSWGTSPQDVVSINGSVPNPENAKSSQQKQAITHALNYMGLTPGQKITDIKIDRVFIGSCTNGRIEDLRQVSKTIERMNQKVAPHVQAMIVPGSGLVKEHAEAEGLDQIFINAGFEWRDPGCSMCLAMNDDRLEPGERCASTSSRNFEGRQGRGGRTHLVSPAMAAAAALAGHFVDVRVLEG